MVSRTQPFFQKEAGSRNPEEIATLLQIKGENPYKSRAYLNAARTIGSLQAT